MNMKDRLESTTSYFTDEEDEAVKEFAYGKIRSDVEGLYDDPECFQYDAPSRHLM
jgi:hypothetical protein